MTGKGSWTNRVVLLGALVALVLSAAACTDDDAQDPVREAASTTTTPSGVRNAGFVSAMLAVSPALGEDAFQVEVVDLAKVRALNAVAPANSSADAEGTKADIEAIAPPAPGAKAGASVPPSVRRAATASYADFRRTFGWSLPDVDAFVTAMPPHPVTMKGRFDEAALTAALGPPTSGGWASGGSGKLDIERATPANPTGQSVRIALAGDVLVHGLDDASTSAAVRAANGQGPTLADDTTLAALAAALDDADVYGALLVRRSSFTPRPGRSSAAPSSASLPARFTGIASGGAADGSGPVHVLVWSHMDGAAATKNAGAVEKLLADGTSDTGKAYAELFDVVEVKTAGSTVTARLRPKGQRPSAWADFLVRGQEPLQTHA